MNKGSKDELNVWGRPKEKCGKENDVLFIYANIVVGDWWLIDLGALYHELSK